MFSCDWRAGEHDSHTSQVNDLYYCSCIGDHRENLREKEREFKISQKCQKYFVIKNLVK